MAAIASQPELLDYSAWAERPEPLAPLESDERADVVVIGGGYLGISAARRLAGHGRDVVLLEAEFCGWGASARNAGHLTPTIAGDPQVLATLYRRRAPALVQFADRAVRHTEQLIEADGIDCGYRPVGNVSVALTEAGLKRSARIARFMQSAGAHVELVTASEHGLPDAFPGGILEKLGGVLDPGRFTMGLRDRLLASPVRTFEGSPVISVTGSGGAFTVRTPRGSVSAREVLVATNAFSDGLAFAPERSVAPLWVTLAETEPIDPAAIEATGWTSTSGIYTQHFVMESYDLTSRNTIVFGSRMVTRERAPLRLRLPDRAVVEEITRGFRERFPTLAGVAVERAWGGWIAMTPSWLPAVGRTSEGIHYAVGCNGHGIAQAPYLGSMIADSIAGLGRAPDLATLWRDRDRFAPSPLTSKAAVKLAWHLDRLGDRLAARGHG